MASAPFSFSLLPNGSLVLSKLLHGHVSRVRSIDVQSGRILSGSDDRSLKVRAKEQNFMTKFRMSIFRIKS